MILDEFKRRLRSLIGSPSSQRPFICEGSPLECNVAIVGFNPATELNDDFWSHWRSGYGFDKGAWFEAYKLDRASRPLKPGKTRRPAVSNTRRVLNWISEAAAPAPVLETNVFSVASATKADLSLSVRESAPFRFLMEAVKPAVVVAHGIDAQAAVSQLHLTACILNVDHFSRGWSEVRARALGVRICGAVRDAGATDGQQGASPTLR